MRSNGWIAAAKRAFLPRPTVRPDLGERLLAQRFPGGVADAEEVTGSNPLVSALLSAGRSAQPTENA
jgi:hypothetical protein